MPYKIFMDYILINTYLSGKATENEVEIVYEWINASPDNKALYIQLKKIWALSQEDGEDNKIAWNKLQKEIKLRKRKLLIYSWIKYAAVFVGLIGILIFFQYPKNTKQNLIIDKDAVTLELDNGRIEVLTSQGVYKIVDKENGIVGKQKGETLIYKTETLKPKELVFNKLTVPYGKTFQIILSDGTKVHINAGSSLKYPVSFEEGGTRHVFLEGEAFFEVKSDQNHPFIVSANNMNIRVLGTKFNISSYIEDKEINTVLIEGSVRIYEKGNNYSIENSSILEPGYKAEWNIINKKVTFEKVDTSIYTDWIDGRIVFSHMSFKNICKKLERRYNVTITNNDKKLDEEIFTASFDIETIEQVLNSFNKNFTFQYEMKGNQIIINKSLN